MAANEIHKNDVGTVFEVTLRDDTIIVDVASATVTKELVFKSPKPASGTSTVSTKAASFTTDGTDGKIQYTTIANDLNEIGLWNLQAHVILSTGDWRSDIQSFEVFANLE